MDWAVLVSGLSLRRPGDLVRKSRSIRDRSQKAKRFNGAERKRKQFSFV